MKTPNGKGIIVRGNCVFCGETYQTAVIPEKEWDDYCAGAMIQNAMPSVNTDDREFLISGISPKGWNLHFGGKDVN